MAQRVNNRRGDGEQLRTQLLRSATELLLAPQELTPPSLRAIARASGVAPSAVYLHFPSQAELVAVVIADQYAELRSALDEADDLEAEPRARLIVLAEAYVAWGLDHPGAYQLLFESADVLPRTPSESLDGHNATASTPGRDHGPRPAGPGLDLLERVANLVDLAGPLLLPSPEVAIEIWVALHGLISLRLHKPEAPWLQDPTTDGRRIVKALLATNLDRRGAPTS